MSLVPSESEDAKPARLSLRGEAQDVLDGYTAFLKSPAFQHNMDLAVLTKIAGDENVPYRERRRAAEVLGKLRLQAMEALAELSAVRAQVLRELGLEEGPKTVALTQVNTKIEIVRSDDWRGADGEFVDGLLEPPPDTEARREPPGDS